MSALLLASTAPELTPPEANASLQAIHPSEERLRRERKGFAMPARTVITFSDGSRMTIDEDLEGIVGKLKDAGDGLCLLDGMPGPDRLYVNPAQITPLYEFQSRNSEQFDAGST